MKIKVSDLRRIIREAAVDHMRLPRGPNSRDDADNRDLDNPMSDRLNIEEAVSIGFENIDEDVNIPESVYSSPRARMTIRNAKMRALQTGREKLETLGASIEAISLDSVKFRVSDASSIHRINDAMHDVTDFWAPTTKGTEVEADVRWSTSNDPEVLKVVKPAEDAFLNSLSGELQKAGMRNVKIDLNAGGGGATRVRGTVSRANKQHIYNVLAQFDPIISIDT